MRILVVGGTKFIGPHVVHQLAASGHAVTVYHRGRTEADLPSGVRHVHDAAASMPVLAFPDEVLRPVPDVVIHMVPLGERDARAAVDVFGGRARRLVAVSSGDVYRAYGRFTGLEPGPVEPGPLHETSPLRTVLYPYRKDAKSADDWLYSYEKIWVERVVLGDASVEGVVLRLPKVYGPGGNADFATVRGFRHQPQWRWTHGYVENVAAAIVLAAVHESPASRVYNVGEEHTPALGERLQDLGDEVRAHAPGISSVMNFAQNIVYDTSRIRRELGYVEPVPYLEGVQRTLSSL
ncbi:MAG TPA: NAD-dependent epimerase/dehydratase family protein [Vicinamibacterales bacterium]